MADEAALEDSGARLVPVSPGWFVANARDLRWSHKPEHGESLPLTSCDERTRRTARSHGRFSEAVESRYREGTLPD